MHQEKEHTTLHVSTEHWSCCLTTTPTHDRAFVQWVHQFARIIKMLIQLIKKKKARVLARQLTGLVLSAGSLSQQNLSCLKFPNTTCCCSLAPLHRMGLPLPSPSSLQPTQGHHLHHPPQMLTFTTPSLKYSSLTHSEATSPSVPTVSTVRLPDRAFCTHVSADN